VTPDAPRNASRPVPRPCDGPLPRRGRVVWPASPPGCRDHRQQAARQSRDHSEGAL